MRLGFSFHDKEIFVLRSDLNKLINMNEIDFPFLFSILTFQKYLLKFWSN